MRRSMLLFSRAFGIPPANLAVEHFLHRQERRLGDFVEFPADVELVVVGNVFFLRLAEIGDASEILIANLVVDLARPQSDRDDRFVERTLLGRFHLDFDWIDYAEMIDAHRGTKECGTISSGCKNTSVSTFTATCQSQRQHPRCYFHAACRYVGQRQPILHTWTEIPLLAQPEARFDAECQRCLEALEPDNVAVTNRRRAAAIGHLERECLAVGQTHGVLCQTFCVLDGAIEQKPQIGTESERHDVAGERNKPNIRLRPETEETERRLLTEFDGNIVETLRSVRRNKRHQLLLTITRHKAAIIYARTDTEANKRVLLARQLIKNSCHDTAATAAGERRAIARIEVLPLLDGDRHADNHAGIVVEHDFRCDGGRFPTTHNLSRQSHNRHKRDRDTEQSFHETSEHSKWCISPSVARRIRMRACFAILAASTSHAEDDMSTDPLNTDVTPHLVDRAPLFEQEGPRGVAVRSLLRIESTSIPAARVVHGELATHRHWDEFERALYQELVYGTLRWRAKLDWVLTGFYHGDFPKCMPAVQNALRVALYQILMISKVPPMAAIESAVRTIERLKSTEHATKLGSVLRTIARNVAGIRYPPREQLALHLSIVHSHPLWLVERWIERYGVELTEQMLAAALERAPLYLAANSLRVSDEHLRLWLQEHGIPFEVSPLHQHLLRVNPFADYEALPIWQEGWFYTTDPMSATAAAILDKLSPRSLVFVCRETSSAVLPFAELAETRNAELRIWTASPTGSLFARDHERLGWHAPSVITELGDRTYEAVCVEAPSSGIGLWRRMPERKWRSDSLDIPRAIGRSRAMLDQASAAVAPGGTLLVMVASTEPEETTSLVEWLVATHPDLKQVPISPDSVHPSLLQDDGTLQSLPHIHRCDSVFVALFEKTR